MTMMFVAVGASALVGGIGALSANRASQAQARAQAQAADYNAAVAKQKADATSAAFNMREEAKRRENRIISGKRVAAIAQNGTGFTGSNLAFADQQGVSDELDALNIRYQGQLEARGLLADSALSTWSAENARGVASTINRGAFIGVASSALSSGASAYSMGAGGRASAAANVGYGFEP